MLSFPLLKGSAKQKPMSAFCIEEGSFSITIQTRRNIRARRYSLRFVAGASSPVLTIPKRGSVREAKAFALRNIGWLQVQFEKRAQHYQPFVDGAEFPLYGTPCKLVATGAMRGAARLERTDSGWLLHMAGDEAHLARRTVSWLKAEARSKLEAASLFHAKRLGVTYSALTLRDQKTRWGSCSTTGRLNYSWRLILAPPDVLDYVAAHEVAHLKEMNHSAQFWAQVRRTCPDYETPKMWLKENGMRLHAVGV